MPALSPDPAPSSASVWPCSLSILFHSTCASVYQVEKLMLMGPSVPWWAARTRARLLSCRVDLGADVVVRLLKYGVSEDQPQP